MIHYLLILMFQLILRRRIMRMMRRCLPRQTLILTKRRFCGAISRQGKLVSNPIQGSIFKTELTNPGIALVQVGINSSFGRQQWYIIVDNVDIFLKEDGKRPKPVGQLDQAAGGFQQKDDVPLHSAGIQPFGYKLWIFDILGPVQ